MAYDITIEEKGEYIRIEISGDRVSGKVKEDTFKAWSQVADKCRETGIFKVLAILKLSGRVPVLLSYETAKNAEKFGWSRSFRLAIVDTNKESLKDNRFSETTAFNRGYTLRVFDNKHDAIIWLLDS